MRQSTLLPLGFALASAAVLGACGDDGTSPGTGGVVDATGGATHEAGTGGSGAAEPSGTGSTGTGAASGGSENTGGVGTGGSGASPADGTELCERWNADRADMSESAWTGSVDTCTAGDMSATSRDNALRLVNLARWIAHLPAVAMSTQYNQDDQACALMMTAEDRLSHSPTNDWDCYTAAGASAAAGSCIAGTGAVRAVDLYLVDPGNETTLGHRRWVLSNWLGPVGFGSTGSYSCMRTGTDGNADREWTAWPAPGAFPIQATNDGWNRTLDETGWSIQSDDVDLSNANVTITANGDDLPVTVTALQGGYGSNHAISIIPDGWETQVGTTYTVSVASVDSPFSYSVTIVDCDE